MKLIKSYFEILTSVNGSDILKNIEVAGRVCYKSEDKIADDSSVTFVKMLLSAGHESVIEHQSISVRFVIDRGVSHELVRHRLASFSQESTRYCNYSKDKHGNNVTFIIPPWVDIPEGVYEKSIDNKINVDYEWFNACFDAEKRYLNLVTNSNWTAQQARSVLPNSLKTEIVVTANLREWRTILKQRTTKAAHPQMREVMNPLLKELKTLIPVIFNDIHPYEGL